MCTKRWITSITIMRSMVIIITKRETPSSKSRIESKMRIKISATDLKNSKMKRKSCRMTSTLCMILFGISSWVSLTKVRALEKPLICWTPKLTMKIGLAIIQIKCSRMRRMCFLDSGILTKPKPYLKTIWRKELTILYIISTQSMPLRRLLDLLWFIWLRCLASLQLCHHSLQQLFRKQLYWIAFWFSFFLMCSTTSSSHKEILCLFGSRYSLLFSTD